MKRAAQMTSRTRLAITLLMLHALCSLAASATERRDEGSVQAGKPLHAFAPRDKVMIKGTSTNSGKKKLRGNELRRVIAGKKITPDTTADQVAMDFTEFFYADGKWMSARRERSLVQKSGTWSVSGSKICIKMDSATYDACREFWFSSNPPRAYSHDLDSGSLRSGVISFIVEPIS